MAPASRPGIARASCGSIDRPRCSRPRSPPPTAFGNGFTALANQLAVAGLGVATLGLVVLGLGMMFSMFDRGVMTHFEDGLLRIIGGSAIAVGAGVAASFITTNFHL